jgi:hypothetical protein
MINTRIKLRIMQTHSCSFVIAFKLKLNISSVFRHFVIFCP